MLAVTATRCRGHGCPQAESCERHRQLGRDEMQPKGTLPERIPVADTLRSAPGGTCGWLIRAKEER